MNRQKKLIDVTPDWVAKGIFHFLDSQDVPWKDQNISLDLDLDYYGNHSGNKFISPLVEHLLSENGELSDANLNRLAQVIFTKHGRNWSELWETLNYEYDPIENYNMIEQHTGSDTHTYEPIDYKETTTQKPTNWQTETEGLKEDNTSDTNTSYYGFGSDDPAPVQDTNSSVKNKQTVKTTGTYETETAKEGSEVDTMAHDTTLTRSGNIGVTTSQQMIQAQRELWYFKIFDIVFKDIDNILTLSIY